MQQPRPDFCVRMGCLPDSPYAAMLLRCSAVLHLHVLNRPAIYIFLSHSCNAQANLAHPLGQRVPYRQQLPRGFCFILELHRENIQGNRISKWSGLDGQEIRCLCPLNNYLD